jgi:hypothetical protein
MNKKKTIVSLVLISLIIIGLLYLSRKKDSKNINPKIQITKFNKKNSVNKISNQNEKSVTKLIVGIKTQTPPFSEQNVIEIKKCISSYSSSQVKNLKKVLFPKNSKVVFSKNNIHLKNNAGVIYQKRSEGDLRYQDHFYYIVQNDLPIKISEAEFDQETAGAKVIYKESTQKSKSSEVIIVNDKIVKIERNLSSNAISCEYFEGNWECLCFKN